MIRGTSSLVTVVLTLACGVLGTLGTGCQSGGVGDPCIPEDEYQPTFAGYKQTEVNIESRSFQCETRLCLVNHFQGRTSCPYGQAPYTSGADPADGRKCRIPGGSADAFVGASVTVPRGCQNRPKGDAVYCSCRCDGPDPNSKYCDCPSGYECTPLLKDIGLGAKELAGSYCVKAGTVFQPPGTCAPECRSELGNNCGSEDGSGW